MPLVFLLKYCTQPCDQLQQWSAFPVDLLRLGQHGFAGGRLLCLPHCFHTLYYWVNACPAPLPAQRDEAWRLFSPSLLSLLFLLDLVKGRRLRCKGRFVSTVSIVVR